MFCCFFEKNLYLVFSSLFNRRGICEKLRRELKYDVFIFDYRGFGDSTGEPTEEGLIRDARYVYDWLHNASNGHRKIYIWGQSLGSAVACQLAARLSDDESMKFNFQVFIYLFIQVKVWLVLLWKLHL